MHPTRGSGHAGRIDSILKREFPGQELYTVKTPALNGRLCTYPQSGLYLLTELWAQEDHCMQAVCGRM
jgi:hypothetical protein